MNAQTTSNRPRRVIILDTSLRDGAQAAGSQLASATHEKVQIAHRLARMGVDVIEAGFPISSDENFESVKRIATEVKGIRVCGLARAHEADIDCVAQACAGAERWRIHTFIATSKIHMEHKLRLRPEEVLQKIDQSVKQAASLTCGRGGDVEWSAEDATRSDIEFLIECVGVAIAAGATTINLPDTVGYLQPQEYAAMFQQVMARHGDDERIIFSTHCHQDLGLAVANTLAGLAAGARQFECTMNGFGERAGNAALEEIVMNIHVRKNYFNLQFNEQFQTNMLLATSQFVSAAAGFAVPANKAIVGSNAFAHQSGIHQDGVLKNRETYEIMRPETVGWKPGEYQLPLGSLSGQHAFRDWLMQRGFSLADDELQNAFKAFKNLCAQKKHVYEDDIMAIVLNVPNAADDIQLESLSVKSEYSAQSNDNTVTVVLKVAGQLRSATAHGNGATDAAFNAINHMIGMADVQLLSHHIENVTSGSDAQAAVSLMVQWNGEKYSGSNRDPNTTVATIKAYLSALSKAHTIGRVRQQTSVPLAQAI